jgi:hypothetical protein
MHRVLVLLFALLVAAVGAQQAAAPAPTAHNNAVPRHVALAAAAAHSPRADPACKDRKAKGCTEGKSGRPVTWKRH